MCVCIYIYIHIYDIYDMYDAHAHTHTRTRACTHTQDLIKAHVVIALFLTMLIGSGGNAGGQSVAKAIHEIAVRGRTNGLVLKEKKYYYVYIYYSPVSSCRLFMCIYIMYIYYVYVCMYSIHVYLCIYIDTYIHTYVHV